MPNEECASLRLTVLGCTGSIPVSRTGREIFGGSTSCYMVQAGDDTLFLDAGSGLISAPVEFPHPPLILLSHMHLDHVIGLAMYRRLLMKGEKTLLCLPSSGNRVRLHMLNRLFSPPFWPLSLTEYAGDLELVPGRFPMQFGPMRIECLKGRHPGGCRIFRVSSGEKSLVYVTDYEHTASGFAELAEFSAGADLLLYDAQFSREEYVHRQGFGHSTAEKGIELMTLCGAKRLLFIHHAPESSDRILSEREAQIGRPDVRYAREGEVILL